MNRLRAYVQLSPPKGISEDRYRASLAAPLALGVSLGIQLTLALMISIGPRAEWPPRSEVTIMGYTMLRPEYDFAAYLCGCGATVLLILAATVLWNRHLHGAEQSELSKFLRFGVSLQIGAALISLGCFLAATEIVRRLVFGSWRLSAIETTLVLAPSALAAALVGIHYASSPGALDRGLLPRILARLTARRTALGWTADGLACLVICLIVYVPTISHLSGEIYLQDEFFHWDQFMMAPALSFLHGKALGAEVYSQYGVGYPLGAVMLSPLLPLSYPNVLFLAVLYACAYYVGCYVLLRLAVRERALALSGLFAILWLTLFPPIFAEPRPIWMWPSSTILRAPMDVWFFLALMRHAATGRSRWAAAAGSAVGLAVLIEIDTGVPLAVVFAVYCLAYSLAVNEEKRPAKSLWLGAIAAVAILTVGLSMASRGTLLSSPAAFWAGWLEGLLGYAASGAGSIILLARVTISELAFFAALLILCLAPIAKASIDLMHRRLSPATLLLMCGGLYGLARETLFIQRSLQTNLYHTAAPAAVIFVVLIAQWRRYGSGGSASKETSNESSQAAGLSIRHWMPYGCLGASLALLWFSPAFHAYPGALRTMTKGYPQPGLALFENDRTIEGIPEHMGARVAGVQGALAGIQNLRSQGHSVVVLDDSSTLFNLATDNPPLFRDAAIFFDTFTTEQQAGIRETLYREKPDFALIRKEEPSGFFSDTWLYLREALAEGYVPYGDAGLFEVWRRND